jgi:CheY-like chemotaxis protein
MSRTFRVLIVEDEAIVAADVESMLRRRGYEPVGTAATGREAIRQARERQPDIVLMDVRLRGDMSGTEAAKQIEAEQSVPVIYVTAFAERVRLQLPPGALCLAKPFTPAQLWGVLETVLAERPLVA